MSATPEIRARTLLSYLWGLFDRGGISVGRSHESILLEAAMDLLGPPDKEDMNRDYGDNVVEARNYISDKMAGKLGLHDIELPPTNPAYRREL